MSCPVSCPDLQISLRPVQSEDADFLFRVYASTREAERSAFAWTDDAWNAFLRNQFELQHAQYMRGYICPSFDLILQGDIPVGRLYVDRQAEELRIIDIALLPTYRGLGIGTRLMCSLLADAAARVSSVSLHVAYTNPALGLYRRLGFRVAQAQGPYLHLRCEARVWSAGQPGRAMASSELPD